MKYIQTKMDGSFQWKSCFYLKRIMKSLYLVTNSILDGMHLRFRGGLAFKAHRRLYHPTLGSRVIKKKRT